MPADAHSCVWASSQSGVLRLEQRAASAFAASSWNPVRVVGGRGHSAGYSQATALHKHYLNSRANTRSKDDLHSIAPSDIMSVEDMFRASLAYWNQVPLDEYRKNLQKIVEILRPPARRMLDTQVGVSSTPPHPPTPDLNDTCMLGCQYWNTTPLEAACAICTDSCRHSATGSWAALRENLLQ